MKINNNFFSIFHAHLKSLKLDSSKIKFTYHIIEKVSELYPGLEKLVLFIYLGDMANKACLVIGSSGSGKSIALKILQHHISRPAILVDKITSVGMKKFWKDIQGKSISVLVDDLSKAITRYSRLSTAIILTELCYSGFYRGYSLHVNLNIPQFTGSAIINIQPVLYAYIVNQEEFESDIRDKALRFYHLRYPVTLNNQIPNLGQRTKYKTKEIEIKETILQHNLYEKAMENLQFAYTKARAQEHLHDLLKAHANFHDRNRVELEDLAVIELLTRNLRLEPHIFFKEGLESARILDTDFIALLSAIATFKVVSVKYLMERFQISKSQIYEILIRQSDRVNWIKQYAEVIPNDETVNLLKEIGEWKEV